MIRTKEDTCDMDDGVYFEKTGRCYGYNLQQWVNAVDGTQKVMPIHKKKCIRVDYKVDII